MGANRKIERQRMEEKRPMAQGGSVLHVTTGKRYVGI